MKVVVVVVVYNRLDNVKLWLNSWKTCEKPFGAELIIVHNFDNSADCSVFSAECLKHGVRYVPRKNRGFDIGVYQDIFKDRLLGFEDNWDYGLFCADDTIPINRNFVSLYLEEIKKPNVGVVCLEVSREVKLHIRTTGFMISKEVANKLVFPVEIILTKMHCYLFEHRSPNAFYEQILKKNLSVIQIKPTLRNAPLWDTGNRKNLNRWKEHYDNFPKKIELSGNENKTADKVLFICPIYNSYPQIISSLICQTHKNWELLLIHDGKNITGLKKIIEDADDKRITYIESEKRENNWGHHLRQWALKEVGRNNIITNANYIVITNPDNYYTILALEEAVKVFKTNKEALVGYFGQFVHGYTSNQKDGTYKFGVLNTKLELGWIDCGGAVIKREIATEIGWNSMEIYSDWTFYEEIIKRYGKEVFYKIKGCHFIHT